MSIIKSILHKYNATSKAYDTLHPETESAQVTDWNQGIVNTLASTALGGLVNTLTSDSLLAKMIQKVLTATGVKYNIDQNGYICFGSLFGNLIIQWGVATGENVQSGITSIATAIFPIAYKDKRYHVITSIKDGGTQGSWAGTSTWAQNYNLAYVNCCMVAEHSLSAPVIAYVAFGV